MSKKFTLDDIRTAAEREYGNTELELDGHTVVLLNPLRMEKAKRDELMELQKELDAEKDESAEDTDQEEVLDAMFLLIAQTEGQGRHVSRTLNLAEKVTVLNLYGKEAELGEASDSQS
jgi:hypothetical protein